MISLYTGSVGSGKSYHSIEVGLQVIKEGRHVIANFPIKPKKRFLTNKQKKKHDDQFNRWLFDDEITIEKLVALSFEKGWYGKESQCMVIIDEAGILFNSRDWQTAGDHRRKWIKFLSQSRKFGYDFVFVAQSDRMIDKQIRGLVEYEVKHLKANNSFFFSFLSIFRITLFMYIYKWYQTKLKGNIRFSKYSQSVADRYDTMRTFNMEELLQSLETMYQGALVPAPVAVQLEAMKEQVEKMRQERAGGLRVPSASPVAEDTKVLFKLPSFAKR